MNERERLRKRERLNRLGVEWYHMPEQGNEGVRLGLCVKIFELAYELFPPSENNDGHGGEKMHRGDALGLFFEKDWDKFDPGKGDLYGFMSFRLKNRIIDLMRQDMSGYDSIDVEISSEDDTLVVESIVGDIGVDDSELMINDTVSELMTLMLNMKKHLPGRAGNETRINYFRIFFTDGVVSAIKAQTGLGEFTRRERDLFTVIKTTFLYYFMCRPCCSVQEIYNTDLKPYGQMVKGRPMEPPEQPLPNDVYVTYLEKVEHYTATAPAVSQQRTTFRKFLQENLLC